MGDQTWKEFLRDLESVRAVTPQVGTVTRKESDSGRMLHGHFSVFDRWYEIDSVMEGRFLERVSPGAFRKTFSEQRSAIKVLYDHGNDPQLGNKVLGSISELREDRIGAYYEVDLHDTSYVRDLTPGLEAGEYGSSFRFRVVKDEWDDEPKRSGHNPEGLPERSILEVRVYEFGPVTFPASPSATAGIRSLTDEFYGRAVAAVRHTDLLARARKYRTPEMGAAPSPAEPPNGTRRTPTHAARMVQRIDAYRTARK